MFIVPNIDFFFFVALGASNSSSSKSFVVEKIEFSTVSSSSSDTETSGLIAFSVYSFFLINNIHNSSEPSKNLDTIATPR